MVERTECITIKLNLDSLCRINRRGGVDCCLGDERLGVGPGNVHRQQCVLCLRLCFSCDADKLAFDDHCNDTGVGRSVTLIDRCDGCTDDTRASHNAPYHVGESYVVSILCAAVDFVGDIKPLFGCPNQRKRACRFEGGRCLRSLPVARVGGDNSTVCELFAGRAAYPSGRHGERPYSDCELASGRCDQHLTQGGCGSTQRGVVRNDAFAVAGPVGVLDRRASGIHDDADVFPRQRELFGGNLCQRRQNALAHFDFLDMDGQYVICTKAEPLGWGCAGCATADRLLGAFSGV